jgi:hypothetical protein
VSAKIQTVVVGSDNVAFDPASCSRVKTFDANANVLTDTATDSASISRVKTFTYIEVNGVWVAETESRWILAKA